MTQRDAPATARNREPILGVLERWLKQPARVLEIASGTGQHAVFFAQSMPHLEWQPTDADPESLPSIKAWSEAARLENVAPPRRLDVCAGGGDAGWPAEAVDAIFCANMIHIAPWAAALGLLRGAGRTLVPGGLLFLYGPFKVDGAHTAPSNVAFDESLRLRDAAWGIRDREAVVLEAEKQGLSLAETNLLPANNQLLVFSKGTG